MSKEKIIATICKYTGISKKNANALLKQIVAIQASGLQREGHLKLPGIGSFGVRLSEKSKSPPNYPKRKKVGKKKVVATRRARKAISAKSRPRVVDPFPGDPFELPSRFPEASAHGSGSGRDE